jgi:hypothetical protein
MPDHVFRNKQNVGALHQETLALPSLLFTTTENSVIAKTSGRIAHEGNSGILFINGWLSWLQSSMM